MHFFGLKNASRDLLAKLEDPLDLQNRETTSLNARLG